MYKKLRVCNVCLNARGTEGKSLYVYFQTEAGYINLKIPERALWASLGTACALGHNLTLLWQA